MRTPRRGRAGPRFERARSVLAASTQCRRSVCSRAKPLFAVSWDAHWRGDARRCLVSTSACRRGGGARVYGRARSARDARRSEHRARASTAPGHDPRVRGGPHLSRRADRGHVRAPLPPRGSSSTRSASSCVDARTASSGPQSLGWIAVRTALPHLARRSSRYRRVIERIAKTFESWTSVGCGESCEHESTSQLGSPSSLFAARAPHHAPVRGSQTARDALKRPSRASCAVRSALRRP